MFVKTLPQGILGVPSAWIVVGVGTPQIPKTEVARMSSPIREIEVNFNVFRISEIPFHDRS
jgi:hypothetical protein